MRAYTIDDVTDLHAIVSQEAVMRYLPEDVMSLRQTEKGLRWIIECYGKNTPERVFKFSVGVVEKMSGRLIGWCGLGPLEFDRSEIEIYYGLSPPYWRRGMATEAAKTLLNYGFQTIGLKKIAAIVQPENIASQRIIEKLGLQYQKTIVGLPEKYKFFEGFLYYSFTRQEYMSKMGIAAESERGRLGMAENEGRY